MKKAKRLFDDLKRDSPSTGAKSDDFQATTGFDRFKKRRGIYSVIRHGEAVSATRDTAVKFVGEFVNYIESEGLSPQQVFNFGETGFVWKRMPKKTYITKDRNICQDTSLWKTGLHSCCVLMLVGTSD